MSIPSRPGRIWRLLSMAVIAVPWFMRDQLATTLDHHTQTAQQVMDALRNERQRQARDHEQRDTSQRLQRIEIDVLRLAKSSTDQEADEAMAQARVQELHDEAEALSSAAGELKALLAEVSLGADQRQRTEGAAAAALTSAERLTSGVQVGTDEKTVKVLLAPFDQASDKLEKAYEDLHNAADAQRAASARWANASRFLAWLLTGLGAWMIGGWRRVLDPAGQGDS
jgi:hypothetical protein